MSNLNLKKLLQSVVVHKASDLHLISKKEPLLRLSGKLRPINMPKLTGEDIEEMCYALLTEKQKKKFEEDLELDFALELEGVGRFRANYYKTLGDMPLPFV